MEWGEFKVGDLFDIGTGSLLSAEELSQKGKVPRISAKSDNNGILGYFDSENMQSARHFENFISVNFFGSDGGIFYHPYKASVEMKVHTLKIPKVELNEKTGAFICAALHKVLGGFGYGSQLSSSKLKNLDFKVKLPVKNGSLDLHFMEDFIALLETEYTGVLDGYLVTSGLSNCQLTLHEQEALDSYQSVQFQDFKVVDIFTVKNSGNILSRDIVENSGTTPYLCASRENNSVSSFISYDDNYLDKGNCVFIGGKTFVVTYQEQDFFSNDSHNLILYLKDEVKRSKLNQLFLSTCVDKSLKHKYSWGDSISNRKIQKDMISLPVKNSKPDLSSVELLMSAVQKLVIKDVLNYVNSKDNASKKDVQA